MVAGVPPAIHYVLPESCAAERLHEISEKSEKLDRFFWFGKYLFASREAVVEVVQPALNQNPWCSRYRKTVFKDNPSFCRECLT